MIEAKNIWKSFEKKEILKDVSAVFEKGKNNLIIGQSGSGKTVFMKCLVGLFLTDSGQVFYNERNFSEMNKKERKKIHKEIGMLFQEGALFDSMSVEENVMFPLTMFTDWTYDERVKRVNECLDHVNLSDVNSYYPAELSGGMKKRVSIARAISMNPRYLFCDEPNSGLDPKSSVLIDNLIRDLTHELQMTTIINTHDMNSVLNMGDQVIFLKEGRVEWKGTKEEILDTGNEAIDSFVYATEMAQRLKKGG